MLSVRHDASLWFVKMFCYETRFSKQLLINFQMPFENTRENELKTLK